MSFELLRGHRPELQLDGIAVLQAGDCFTATPSWKRNWWSKERYGYTPKRLCLVKVMPSEGMELASWRADVEGLLKRLLDSANFFGCRNILIACGEEQGGLDPQLSSFLLLSLTSLQFEHDLNIYLYFPETSYPVEESFYGKLQGFVDEVYEDISKRVSYCSEERRYSASDCSISFSLSYVPSYESEDLGSRIRRLDSSFTEYLLMLIHQSGKCPSDVYKKALIDRKLFSKIRCNREYKPTKATAVAFAMALELDLNETEELLKRAGYALSHSNKFDVIVEYFIEQKNYNILMLNEVLFKYDQPLIGALG
jgi:hypothetical protein